MGKSPAKWIKTLLFGKKSARSHSTKGRNSSVCTCFCFGKGKEFLFVVMSSSDEKERSFSLVSDCKKTLAGSC